MANGYVHERSLLMLVEAASKLNIRINLRSLAPSRCRFARDVAVPVDEYCAVARSVFASRRETLGIELAGALPLEAAGLWGAMLRSSETLASMLSRAQRNARLFFPFTRLLLEPRGTEVAALCLHPDPSPYGPREQVVCLFLGRFLAWARALAGNKIAPTRVTMRWAGPNHAFAFESFFGCPISFQAAEDVMYFEPAILNKPLPGRTPELSGLLEDLASASIRRLTSAPAITEQVRDAICYGLVNGGASEHSIAKGMGMTVRTLRRRLAEKELSFRQLLNECRRARAENLLLDGRLSIADISLSLGYSEAANFYRAFRRWTGVTPAQWRSQAEGAR